MAKRIAFFNHKGGVSKTTTCFNLGWMLASKGKRLINRIYRILLAEEDLPTATTSVFYKNKTYTDKVFNKAIDDMIKDKER